MTELTAKKTDQEIGVQQEIKGDAFEVIKRSFKEAEKKASQNTSFWEIRTGKILKNALGIWPLLLSAPLMGLFIRKLVGSMFLSPLGMISGFFTFIGAILLLGCAFMLLHERVAQICMLPYCIYLVIEFYMIAPNFTLIFGIVAITSTATIYIVDRLYYEGLIETINAFLKLQRVESNEREIQKEAKTAIYESR